MYVIHAATPEVMRDVVVSFIESNIMSADRAASRARTLREKACAEAVKRSLVTLKKTLEMAKIEKGSPE
jgi:hypothetical protein